MFYLLQSGVQSRLIRKKFLRIKFSIVTDNRKLIRLTLWCFKKPQLFNKYIIISPSIWWDNGSLLNLNSELLSDSFNPKTDVYVGVGKEGLTLGQYPRVMEVDANLLAEKIKSTKSKNVNIRFDYLPQEDHATVSHQAVFNALRLLFLVNK